MVVSRASLTSVVQVVDPGTAIPVQPPFVDLRQRVTSTASDDKVLTVDSSQTWGSIGLVAEGSAHYWWVIADLSGIVDPFTDLVPGSKLRSPSVPRLLFEVLGQSKGT